MRAETQGKEVGYDVLKNQRLKPGPGKPEPEPGLLFCRIASPFDASLQSGQAGQSP
jgi:hypothetical protein